MDALDLLEVLHDKIVASVLEQLLFEVLRRMKILAWRLITLTSTLKQETKTYDKIPVFQQCVSPNQTGI